jgi:hypothetical protein
VLEALRWLHDQNAALLHLDADGQLLTTSALPADIPVLRRAQAFAPASSVGIEIARDLRTPRSRASPLCSKIFRAEFRLRAKSG